MVADVAAAGSGADNEAEAEDSVADSDDCSELEINDDDVELIEEFPVPVSSVKKSNKSHNN